MSGIESPIKVEANLSADISESTNETLKILCFPAAEQAGKALGNITGLFNTLTLPIKFINVWAEKNFEKYAEKIKDIPNEKIKEVEPEIGIPLMEKLSYTSNNDLAEAYANLLAKASNKDDVDLIHPGFINKINSMAPDEVKILEYLKNKNIIGYIVFRSRNKAGSQKDISYNLTSIEKELNISIEKVQLHLENLVSLSILEDYRGQWIANDKCYEPLRYFYKNINDRFEEEIKSGKFGEGASLVVEKSYYEITTVGNIFIKACTDK